MLASPSFQRGRSKGERTSYRPSRRYHGDDGRAFHGSGATGVSFGPAFGPGDVIGCGVVPAGEDLLAVYFVRNGQALGVAFLVEERHELRRRDLYPVVGIDSARLRCVVNVGFGAPFALDDARLVARAGRGALEILAKFEAGLTKHAAAAASPRPISTEYLRRSRGVAATRLHGISASQPRRRRDSPPRNIYGHRAKRRRSARCARGPRGRSTPRG